MKNVVEGIVSMLIGSTCLSGIFYTLVSFNTLVTAV